MSRPVKLPSGNWRIQWFDSSGRRKSETFGTLDAARSALRRRETLVEDVRVGRGRELSDQTLREAAAEWLASRGPEPGSAPDVARRRKKQQDSNRTHLDRHILPILGNLRLPEVTSSAAQAFTKRLEGKKTARKGEVNEEGRALRPGTIATVIITLRKMMRDLGYPISVSYTVPTSGYGWIKSTVDVANFLGACREPWFRMTCELAVYAGLRKGEIAGLRWSAVDFDLGIIHVDRSYDGPTKSKHVRYVGLAPALAAQLRLWRLLSGAGGGGLVVTKDGKPITDRTGMSKRTRRTCVRAGVEPVSFHQLRHTAASHLAQRLSPAEVGAILGHADPKTTARYAHVDTGSLARDSRVHLNFEAPSGKVVALKSGAAHEVHTPAGAGRLTGLK